MEVAIIQQDIVWANPEANRRRAEQLMDRLPGAQLYVLPEMFSTGFATEPQGIAEAGGGLSVEWMVQQAAHRRAAVAGSIAVEQGGGYRNRLYFVKPSGESVFYDKRHLFSYGGEDRHYTHGEQRVVVEHGGVRFLLQICYDLRFPIWSRNRGDYDAILYVANWPKSRVAVWKTLLAARAIENQCYVVGVNRVGDDPACHYSGASAIVDAYGRTVAACANEVEDVVSAHIDMAALNAFRQKFPVLNDSLER